MGVSTKWIIENTQHDLSVKGSYKRMVKCSQHVILTFLNSAGDLRLLSTVKYTFSIS